MTRKCKHSKGVERYWDSDGNLVLWCYSCGKDVSQEGTKKP